MKIYFDTLGCLKNYNDTDIASGILQKAGHTVVFSPEEADVIIVNTCGFIEDAKKESISEIFDLLPYREEGKKVLISGCLVQRYAKELFEEIPEADGFVGVNDYARLPELLKEWEKGGEERFAASSETAEGQFEAESEARALPPNVYSASLRIAEGCDRACAYCAIPKIRGPYRSRPQESILQEARRLAEAGCRELLIIAEDTGYYGIDRSGKPELADLLRKLCRIEGIRWIRLLYCYEDHITDDLLQVFAEEEKICPYIDIPLQHISDKVLRAMNRKSTKASVLDRIHALREKVPGIKIRTTIITGFPGETEEVFEELLEFVETEKFERLGAFAFSREEGTPAYDMPDQVPEEEKQRRLDELMEAQRKISLAHNQALVGETLDVMVDCLDEDGYSYLGRTSGDAPDIDNAVIFAPLTAHEPGEIVRVRILDGFDYDLEGMEVES